MLTGLEFQVVEYVVGASALALASTVSTFVVKKIGLARLSKISQMESVGLQLARKAIGYIKRTYPQAADWEQKAQNVLVNEFKRLKLPVPLGQAEQLIKYAIHEFESAYTLHTNVVVPDFNGFNQEIVDKDTSNDVKTTSDSTSK